MLPGISGSLIAGDFLERHVIAAIDTTANHRRTIRQLHRWWRQVESSIGPASPLRLIADKGAMPLLRALDFHLDDLEPHGAVPDNRTPRSGCCLVGILTGDSRRLVLSVAPWGAAPAEAWAHTVRTGRGVGARWGLIYTGRALRIVDATRTWSRRTLDFDLRLALNDERSALALIALVQAAGCSGTAHQTTLDAWVRRSDAHGVSVCASLGDGVLEALTSLIGEFDRERARSRRSTARGGPVLHQALTVVYRLLFLLFAEARAMVPTWHHIYRDSYTIEALCKQLSATPATPGLWKSLQAISRLAHAGCRAGSLTVTAFNGQLFSPRAAPLAEHGELSDDVVRRALVALATTSGQVGRERIAYADLDVEQLGAVYERVLEYEATPHAGRLRLTRTSYERKATGSFYTPRSITDFLVRRALHPLVVDKSSEQILQLRIVDPAMGSGAFLVAACRFLGAALERALAAEGQMSATPSALEQAQIRRLVAQRCLYGVDLNPMAVQLARLSLWLCTLSRDRPLTFLDHRLATGDSLIGATFTDLARRPPHRGPRWRKDSAAQPLLPLDPAAHLAGAVLPKRFRLAFAPEDTPAHVRDKERVLAALSAPGTPLNQWKRAADVWCAASFARQDAATPGVYGDVFAKLTGGIASLSNREIGRIVERALAVATRHRFFHWELAFPEVFFTADGQRDPHAGFDAVVGNPPWEVLRADTGDDDVRERMRGEQSARVRFVRDSGIYRHVGGGHANCYQLFVERALQLTRPGGRLALVLPSGFATDHGSAALRRHLLDSARIDCLIGFDNRAALFPVHRDVKFMLVSATKGPPTTRLSCVFGRDDAGWLDELPDAASEDPGDARPIVLTRSFIDAWDATHLSLPLLRHQVDLEILATVLARIPRLADATGWNVFFGRELNATDDRPHFVARPASADETLLSVVEGKHLEPFRLRSELSTYAVARERAATLVDPHRTFLRPRLGYRDVASATNRLTLIAAQLPPGVVSTHTVFCSKTAIDEPSRYCLLALLNSLVANYLVRLQVTTHVSAGLMARLPVPKPARDSLEARELAALARGLEETGVAADEAAYARLNAVIARLYGLTGSQYEHVLSTFPLLPRSLRDACQRDYPFASSHR